jgi:hypothetical protein
MPPMSAEEFASKIGAVPGSGLAVQPQTALPDCATPSLAINAASFFMQLA